MAKRSKGRYYQYGYRSGFNASYDTDWRPGEMKKEYERDNLREVVGQILENWQQVAGSIYYLDRTDLQLEAFETGFYDGFEDGVKKQLRGK